MDSQKSIFFLASTPIECPFAPHFLHRNFLTSLRPFALPHVHPHLPVSAFILGIGHEKAIQRLTHFHQWLKTNRISPIIFHFGFSGATIEKWPMGTVFIPHFFEDTLQKSKLFKSMKIKIPLFKSVQVERVVNSESERTQIFNQSGAVAMDMESYTAQSWANHHQYPFLGVRVIFDTPEHQMGPFDKLVDEKQNIRWGSLFKNYVSRPGQLLRLKRAAGVCQKKLNETATLLLNELHNVAG